MKKGVAVNPKKFVVSATELHRSLGLTGNALDWARNLNGKHGWDHDRDYDVPDAPDDYEIYYTEEVSALIRKMYASALPQIFMFDGCGVRIIEKDGEPWFVAADIASVLGYANPQKAIREHCKGVNETVTPTSGGDQTVKIIPERDVYRLIMRSKLPSAERFEEWVVGEVLPSLRKTGTYQVAPQAPQVPQTLPEALRLAADLAETVETQKREMIEMKPKVEALDRLSDAEGSLCLSDAAKALQFQPRKFMEDLHKAGWIHRRSDQGNFIAYQNKIKAGYLIHKITVLPLSDGTERIKEQVRVTPKGMAKLAVQFAGKSNALERR